MITFVISLLALVLGYIFYGKYVERVFEPENKRVAPSIRKFDGVDFIKMPTWKVFMIQFLNIAGTGPIFGAIMGMLYGPAAYLWIVLGCIFAGATHDYLSGMISVRKGGISLPEMVGQYLGPNWKKLMLVFSVLLLILVGAVFVLSPAKLLTAMMPKESGLDSIALWIIVIFVYYVIATMMPVDKIIGKIYPIFAFSLLFMAVALMATLFIKWPALPELWSDFDPVSKGITNSDPLLPALFITIACGAISGFHATQSPLMARCINRETLGRPVFYGAMITEGIVALVWCTVSSWFFFCDGWRDICPAEFLAQNEKTLTQFFDAPSVVMNVCNGWLGVVGGVLAVLGVVAAPITSGDTALRSARLIVADAFKIDQTPIIKRLMICAPIFLASIALLFWQLDNPDSFNTIWKYFGWANQTLAVFTLWTITVYLALKKKLYVITLIPAVFMTFICTSFLAVSKISLGLPLGIGYTIGILVALACMINFFWWHQRKFKLTYKYNNKPKKRKNNMKKLFVMLAMLTMTVAANAQFEQGKTFLGASLTGLDLNYNGSKKFSLGVNAQVGKFITDNWLLFGQVAYQHRGEPSNNEFKIGVGGRYYILQNGLFLGANLNYAYATEDYNDFKPAIEVGYAFFVSREVTIEPALYYEQSFKSHSDYSTVGLKIGIGLYMPKNKIKDSVKAVLE